MKLFQRHGLLALAIAALAGASAVVSAMLAIEAWQAGVADRPDLESTGTSLQAVIQFACAGLTLAWLYRSIAQVIRQGAEGLAVGPVGAVLWWFVPIANLFMPYKAVSELRKAAIRPQDWQAVGGWAPMGFWWGFWIVSGVANAVLVRAEFSRDADLASIAGSAALISDTAGTVASLLFAIIVLRVDGHLQALSPVSSPSLTA